jgi:hypothetical protein
MVFGAPFFGFEFVMDIDRRRGCGNVGIAWRFPRAVEREGNLFLVFLSFLGPSFPQPLVVTPIS